MTSTHTPHQALIAQLEQALAQHLSGNTDASHDVHHARRVMKNALDIVAIEGAGNPRLLIAASYLHDLINVPKNSINRDQASRLSAEAAKPILDQIGFSPSEVQAIQHCIEAHSFSANIETQTVDAKILQDADRLESLGALGIARTFYTAGKMHSELFDGKDPFGESRELDDIRFAVDHFKTKLLTLADSMKTQAGRKIAADRTQSMREFLTSLAGELHTSHSW